MYISILCSNNSAWYHYHIYSISLIFKMFYPIMSCSWAFFGGVDCFVCNWQSWHKPLHASSEQLCIVYILYNSPHWLCFKGGCSSNLHHLLDVNWTWHCNSVHYSPVHAKGCAPPFDNHSFKARAEKSCWMYWQNPHWIGPVSVHQLVVTKKYTQPRTLRTPAALGAQDEN